MSEERSRVLVGSDVVSVRLRIDRMCGRAIDAAHPAPPEGEAH
jgi:hypothetical protein